MASHVPTIAVVGGGMGGVETTASLVNQLSDRAKIILISETDELALRPFFIYPPFSNIFKNRRMTHLGLRRAAARRGVEFQEWHVDEIDPAANVVRSDGRQQPYDYLIIATGAGMQPSDVPGMIEHSETIWGFEDSLHLAKAVEQMIDRAKRGERQHVLFNVPENNKCAGPLYEMVFMFETYLRRKKVRDQFRITWTTFETSYIAAFGPKLDERTTQEFEERGIEAHREKRIERVEPKRAIFKDGSTIDFDWMISFPPYIAHSRFDSMPTDDRGFIHADPDTWKVNGMENIYAVGDGADFPVKQAFLALGMGGTVAHNLASEITGESARRCFEPLSMCIMEQLDSGLYAQVPLHLTGDPAHAVEVAPDHMSQYIVRGSRLWQAGKWGMYMMLALQMGRLQTFHEGPLWNGMEVMTKGMQKVTK
jgi:NADH dehydrogenase FAD-containing subunit